MSNVISLNHSKGSLIITYELVTDNTTGCPSNAVAAALTQLRLHTFTINGVTFNILNMLVGGMECMYSRVSNGRVGITSGFSAIGRPPAWKQNRLDL